MWKFGRSTSIFAQIKRLIVRSRLHSHHKWVLQLSLLVNTTNHEDPIYSKWTKTSQKQPTIDRHHCITRCCWFTFTPTVKQVMGIMYRTGVWQDKVLKSNTLVILYGLESFQALWFLPLLRIVHLDLLGEYLQLSYLLRQSLFTLGQPAFLALALLCVEDDSRSMFAVFLDRRQLLHLFFLEYFGDVSDFLSVGGLGSFAFSASGLLHSRQQLGHSFGSDQLVLQQFFLEEQYEFLVLEVLLEAASGKEVALFGGLGESADALLVGVHEGDHGGEDGADVPAGTPCFLVVVGEGGADGLADLEASVVGEEAYFGGREGVVFGEVEYTVVEALLVLFLQSVEAEVEGEVVFSVDQHAGDGFLLDALHFLVDAHVGDLLAHLSYISYSLLNYQYIFINLS